MHTSIYRLWVNEAGGESVILPELMKVILCEDEIIKMPLLTQYIWPESVYRTPAELM